MNPITITAWIIATLLIAIVIYVWVEPWINKKKTLFWVWWKLYLLTKRAKNPENKEAFKNLAKLAWKTFLSPEDDDKENNVQD